MVEEFIKRVANIVPSKRQLDWQKLEFYSFIHFGMNTFTDTEWGNGKGTPEMFNPTELDAKQWVTVCKDAGMKAVILTCKHHDGFCLWPSNYTEYSVKNSPWKNGQGDVVREVSNACRQLGLKFGVYLSPWDIHDKSYGKSEEYNNYFLNQLTELLSNYGEIFSVWFDGACGEGENGKKQVYDWESYYNLIRKLQPNAVINICGPDVRWCGNEAGSCRQSEWSVVPSALLDTEKIQDESQKVDDNEFRLKINPVDEDLGSREKLKLADRLIWYPCEVDTSIRPGWFYHEHENDKVKTLEELLHIYYSSVGGNACLLLNIPPDTRGLIHENDVERLKQLGDTIRNAFKNDLAVNATAIASETRDSSYCINNIFSDNSSYWCPNEGTEKASIEIDLKKECNFDKAILMENIECGQRIENFIIEYKEDDKWNLLYKGTTVGYKRICLFNKVNARYLKLTITDSRWCPTLMKFGLY